MKDLNVEALLDDPWVFAINMNSDWARHRKVDLAELVGEPWVQATRLLLADSVEEVP